MVPCGNGICKQTADQCEPLYDCNLNLNAKIRCSDGSCRQSLSQCP